MQTKRARRNGGIGAKGDCKKNPKSRRPGGEPKVITFIAGLVFMLLLISGCTEMTRTEKNLCYSLASQSYAYVPSCTTEASCFTKVDEMFKGSISPAQDSALYSIKNHVARSWFFYNKAVAESKKLSSACSAGDASGLAGEINQVQSYVGTAFVELDQGVRESFAFVSAEEKRLSDQKIDLAKEEAAYDSLVEMRQALSELKTGATNSDSYVSFFLNKATAFNNSAAAKGFTQLVEERPFWIDLIDFGGGTVVSQAPSETQAFFPSMQDSFENAVGAMEALFYKRQGLSALSQFPVNEFMKLYSDLGGNNNSSLKRFADMANRDAANYAAAKKHAEDLWKSVEAKRLEAQALLQQAAEGEKYTELYSKLAAANITREQNPLAEFGKISQEYISLKEEKAKGTLPLGEELAGLKGISNALDEIINGVNFNEEATTQKLGQLCGERAKEIRDENWPATNANINQLIDDVAYFAAKTVSSSGTEQLHFCGELIAKHELLESMEADYAKVEAEMKDSTKECFAYLDKVFAFTQLYELKQTYDALKKTEVTSDNLLWFNQSCLEIKRQVDDELASSPDAELALEQYSSLENSLDLLQILLADANVAGLEAKIDALKNKEAAYSKYFPNGAIDFSQFLPAHGAIASAVEKTASEAAKLVDDTSKYFLDNNLPVPTTPLLAAADENAAGKDTNALMLAGATQKEVSALFEGNRMLVEFLESQIVGNNEALLQAKVVPPITEARLTKLGLQNSDTYNSNDSLEEKKLALDKINRELSDAAEYLRRAAVQAFNNAIDAKAQAAELGKAKGFLHQNDYASALFTLSGAPSPSSPVIYYQAFIPIVLIVAIAFVLRWKFGKKQKEEDIKKGMILEEWKE